MLHQIQQTPGRGYQNIHPFFHFGDLGVHAHAAENHGAGELQVLPVAAHSLFDLCCQFARGGEYQGTDADSAKTILRTAAHGESVQHGQGKGSGFTRSGLCATQQIFAF